MLRASTRKGPSALGTPVFGGWLSGGRLGCPLPTTDPLIGSKEPSALLRVQGGATAFLFLQPPTLAAADCALVARVDARSRKPGSTKPAATVDEWVTAFKHKRDEIVYNHCTA